MTAGPPAEAEAGAEAGGGAAEAGPSPYVEAGGLRLVRPYMYTFRANVKRRWAGRSLRELFAEEFPAVVSPRRRIPCCTLLYLAGAVSGRGG